MLSKLRIGPKLLLAPGVMLILLIVLAACAYVGMVRQNQSLENMVQQRAARMKASADLVAGAHRAHTRMYQLLTWIKAGFSRSRLDGLVRELRQHHAALDRQFSQLGGAIQASQPGGAERRLVAQSQAAHALYLKAINDVVEIAMQDQSIAANAMSKAERAFDAAAQRLEELSQLEQTLGEKAYTEAQGEFRILSIAMPLVVALSIALSLLVTMLVREAMLKDVRDIGAAAADLAEGKLTVKNRDYGKDEIADTARALDTSIRNLNTTLKTILASAQAVDTASRTVAQGSMDLSRRTERQASSLEQTSDAMRELSVTVAQTASNVQLAAQLADCSNRFAARGGGVVQRLGATMASIRSGSRKVVEIVGVIDGLAFQANLLALNSAAAAALAGAQDEAFARMAGEVLGLSQRSAVAAHEIKALVAESLDQIDAGSRAVAEARDNMEEIVASVRQVGDVIGQVRDTSAAQAEGLRGAHQAILELDQMTQQNLALVRQAAAAAAGLQRQALNLSEAVTTFHLDENVAPPAVQRSGSSPRVVRLRLASVRN